ncbi:hypothetical protein [Variovorax beijingensis]|uniref:hypothetical protein n=1 Tax=Variovorax beijingensis TaxID=2496117 RepID=UPI00119EB3BC|nr:hypothetical protein [Variovorax beijingensis]
MKKIPRSWLERHLEPVGTEVPLAGTGDLTAFEARVARAEHTAAQPTPARAMAVVVKAACAQERLDRKTLADRSGLSEDDVTKLLDAAVQPSLRVVAGVSKALRLSRGKLATIAGFGSVKDAQNDAVMVRYATLSKGMSTLDENSQDLVQDFIKFMSED